MKKRKKLKEEFEITARDIDLTTPLERGSHHVLTDEHVESTATNWHTTL